MKDFKKQLTEKYLNHFDYIMEQVANTEFEKPDFPIQDKKHIDVVIKYTDYLANKTEADLMDLYSKSLFSVNKNDSKSEDLILNTTDDLLDHQKILFEKGFVTCFNSLKKNAGHIYSNDAITKCMVVNCGTRLELAKDEFEKFTEQVKEIKTDKESETTDSKSVEA